MLTNDLAIVGIDGQFGDYATIDRVARVLYLGKEHLGKAVETSTIAKFGSKALTKPLTASAQYFEIIDRLLSPLFSDDETNEYLKTIDVTAIIVTDAETNFDTPVEKKIIGVSELSKALTLAVDLINQQQLVVIMGINTHINTGAKTYANVNASTISFDQAFTGYKSASGIVSLLLASKSLALDKSFPIYAELNSLVKSDVNQTDMQKAVKQSLTQTSDKTIGLVEVSALATSQESALEVDVLLENYSGEPLTAATLNTARLTTAISCARSVTGEGGGFSQVLGLVRTVIALQQRYIPGINDWQSPKPSSGSQDNLSKWHASPFYFPTEARPWYPNQDGSNRSAAYSCLTTQSYCHLVLSEHVNEEVDVRLNGHLACSELQLVLVSGDNETDLQDQLSTLLEMEAVNKVSAVPKQYDQLKLIADQQYQQYLVNQSSQVKPYTLALLAESIDELQKEIQLAQVGIKTAFANIALNKSTQWKTPKGSYFTAEPVAQAQENNVCFMYPGIGATYLGLGRDLLYLFPEIYSDIVNLADDISHSLKDSLLNPRSISRLDFNELKQRDLALRGNLADIAEAGVAFSCVFTKIFTDVFKLNADFATGYSMGEVSMYAALGCWQKPSLLTKRLANSVTFNERLSGDLVTLRERWQLPSSAHDEALPVWETYTIKATLADVEAASVDESRVFCTIINTPEQLLIGGFPEDCQRVINKLGVRAMPLNMANAIHSEPAKSEYNNMVELYTMDVNPRINTKLYSSSCYLPVPQLTKAIANSIAKCLCDRVDFPRLVNALYDNGARVFIEMGPGRSLSSWVEKNLEYKLLKDKAATVSVNAKGVNDELSYFRAIAKLTSHGVKLDLKRLFYGTMIMSKK
ncbi:PfaB family protein [Colwellia sp. E2M01]|uniref:PfaB family protein n=1 Tax=Colwellia sp. E2M01 TaxID=2841561 RepID=UPI001C094848|nr:PfaB family protein [Colwellia sp. E2M01]MBU2872226.1 PfaB family protein [Colwellia sp. E2M01]